MQQKNRYLYSKIDFCYLRKSPNVSMNAQWYINFSRRVQSSFIRTFIKYVKSCEQLIDRWLSRLLCNVQAMCNITFHGTHTTLGWSTDSHNTLDWSRNNMSLTYSHMSWIGGDTGLGLDQKHYLTKGIICEMGLHLVVNKLSLSHLHSWLVYVILQYLVPSIPPKA